MKSKSPKSEVNHLTLAAARPSLTYSMDKIQEPSQVAGSSYDDDDDDDEHHVVCDDFNDEKYYRNFYFRRDIYRLLTDLARVDEKDRLVNLVRGRWDFVRGCWVEGVKFPEEFLILKLIECGAVNSAEALLLGEGGWKFDLNDSLLCGTFMLHRAALIYSISLIELFIRHGARTDVVTDGDNLIYNGMLPLGVAVEQLRFHDYLVDWTSKDSIFKLITILCMPQMRVPLEATRLLAQHTKETMDEFYHYAKGGYPLQMAVLLMVARDIVLAPFPSQRDDGSNLNGIMSILRKCIEVEIELLVIVEGRNSEPLWMLKDRKAGLHSALLLLDVFEKAGDAIDDYLKTKPSDMLSKDKVVEDVKSILLKAGFKLKKKDTDLGNIIWKTHDGWKSDGDLSCKDFTRTAAIGFQPQSLQRNVPGKIDKCEQKWAVKSFFPDWTPTLACKIYETSSNIKMPMSKTWFENPERQGAELKTKATSKHTKASMPFMPSSRYAKTRSPFQPQPSSRKYTKTRYPLQPQLSSSKRYTALVRGLMKAAKSLSF